MTHSWCLLSLALLFRVTVPAVALQTTDADKGEMSLGIAAYESAKYPDAIQHLEHALSVNPALISGHLYLALTYDAMHFSTATPDPQFSAQAIREYNRVLVLDPDHVEALKDLAYLLYWLARFDESEGLYRRAVKVAPKDPAALYLVAIFDFRHTYPDLMQEKARLHLGVKQPLIRAATCLQTRQKNLPSVQEGIALLTRTVELVNDVDAQLYLSVLYKMRSELQCNDRAAYETDLKAAQLWSNLACVTWHGPRISFPSRWLPGPPRPLPKRGDTCRW